MTDQLTYSSARWNRLSRSVRRVDDDVVEIRNPTYAVGKLMLNLIILYFVIGIFAHLFSISGDRVFPKRPSSVETFKEMVYEKYVFITDFETYLIPLREKEVEDHEKKINWLKKKDPSFSRDQMPLDTYEEFYEDYANWKGRTPWQRFNNTMRSWDLGPFLFGLMLFAPLRLLMPESNGIRLDAKRRIAYVRDWGGYSIRRFFGLADLRPRNKRDQVDVLERLHFTTDLHVERAVSTRLLYINKLYKFVFPGKKPPMIYLTEDGAEHGYTQRFPMGSYPMRKNQPEEIGQFIEDFFAHPNPGEWTKNLRYRYPLLGDPFVWLNRANLWVFGGYNKQKTEAKIDVCLKEIDGR